MKRVLILGANGMLGRMILDYLARFSNFKIDATVRCPLGDFKLRKELSSVYRNVEVIDLNKVELDPYDYVINCIGRVKPRVKDGEFDSVLEAIEINAKFPYVLISKDGRRKVIQIATDCVFDGEVGYYSETHPHNATDVYGKTKSLGEINAPGFYNLRCSIIGPEIHNKYNLLEWVLGREKGSVVNGFVDHKWNGITTLAFAKLVKGIIERGLQPLVPVQHIVPKDIVTKANLVSIINEFWNLGLIVKDHHTTRVDRTLTTVRPDINQRMWESAGYVSIPTVREMLLELSNYSI